MVIVVLNFLKRSAVDDRLVSFETRTLFPLMSDDRQRAELDAVHSAPRRGLAFSDLNPVEPGLLESLQKVVLAKCA